LARPAAKADVADAGTLAVYRDQLDEIEQNARAGWSTSACRRRPPSRSSAACWQARTRRIAGGGPRCRDSAVRLSAATLQLAALVTVVTLVLYLTQGSPGMPAAPVAGHRGQPPLERAQIGDLVASRGTLARAHEV